MNENGEGGRTTAPHGLEASVLARLRAATRDGPREAQITDEGGGQRVRQLVSDIPKTCIKSRRAAAKRVKKRE